MQFILRGTLWKYIVWIYNKKAANHILRLAAFAFRCVYRLRPKKGLDYFYASHYYKRGLKNMISIMEEEYYMKNKKVSKYKKFDIFDTKAKRIGVCITTAVLLLLIAVLMLLEADKGQLIIKNNTDLNLEYVNAKYVYTEGDVTAPLEIGSIKANDTYKAAIDSINLSGYSANYEIHFKFENYDEMFVDAGLFNAEFIGNMKVNFKKTDDPNILKMTVNAGNGLFNTNEIICDEKYNINLSTGEITQ